MLSEKVKSRLMAHLEITEQRLYKLKFSEVTQSLLMQIRPRTKVDFLNTLKENVHFYIREDYYPQPENFREFYDALLAMHSKFQIVYDMLNQFSTDVERPRCENKPDGLIHIWLKKIPFELW